MKLLAAIIAAIMLLGIAAFCVYGFMATFEPIDNATTVWVFRIGYSVVGIACVAGALLAILKALRR